MIIIGLQNNTNESMTLLFKVYIQNKLVTKFNRKNLQKIIGTHFGILQQHFFILQICDITLVSIGLLFISSSTQRITPFLKLPNIYHVKFNFYKL